MIKPFTEALAIITEVMRHGAASHPANERSVSMESMELIAFSLRAKSARPCWPPAYRTTLCGRQRTELAALADYHRA
jgi:hypothetical protein